MGLQHPLAVRTALCSSSRSTAQPVSSRRRLQVSSLMLCIASSSWRSRESVLERGARTDTRVENTTSGELGCGYLCSLQQACRDVYAGVNIGSSHGRLAAQPREGIQEVSRSPGVLSQSPVIGGVRGPGWAEHHVQGQLTQDRAADVHTLHSLD
ncbi:hypothetical protein CRUP_000695 [Coryphaenoides rupestris]|nr:hypothetical protein CRUP_000695 [Coryphaenoides rupestris]